MFGRLLRAELLRVRHRPRILTALLAIFVIYLVIPATYMYWFMPPTAEELEELHAVWLEMVQSCAECSPETLPFEEFVSNPLALPDLVHQHMAAWGFLAGVLALPVGALYVAADFRSGAMATQLTFTPRRDAVLAARTLVTALLGAVLGGLAAVAMSSVTVVWYVAANGYDAVGDASELLWFMVGTAALSGIAAAIGALLAFLGGTFTILASIAGLYGVSLFDALFGYSASSPIGLWILPTGYGVALVSGSVEMATWPEAGVPITYVIGRPEALAYFGVVLLVMSLLAWFVFPRRAVVG